MPQFGEELGRLVVRRGSARAGRETGRPARGHPRRRLTHDLPRDVQNRLDLIGEGVHYYSLLINQVQTRCIA
jgi:hypothetical protein